MGREYFKTQILLLHSQESTLEVLSAGFNDRYAVHIATSGTEALNTLGETPIHVIVTAQDLPGMSGLEALREAKNVHRTQSAFCLPAVTATTALKRWSEIGMFFKSFAEQSAPPNYAN